MLQSVARLSRILVDIADRSLGRCSYCMRTAFLAAFGAVVAAFILHVLAGGSWMAMAATWAAAGLTSLWLAHVAAFSLRMAGARTAVSVDRRRFLVEFGRAAAIATMATALALHSNSANAACDCSKCRSNQYCCPTANGACGCFPMQCPR